MPQKQDIDRAVRQAYFSDLKPILWIVGVLAAFFLASILWSITPISATSSETGTIVSIARSQSETGRGADYATVQLDDGSTVSLPLADKMMKSGDRVHVCASTKRFIWSFVTYRQCWSDRQE